MIQSQTWALALALVAVLGCSSQPGAIRPPKLNPATAAGTAIEQYDRDGDGRLSEEELSASPALAAVKSDYDTDGDGALSRDEIAAGIRLWQQGVVGARSVPFNVRLNSRPLEGATVRLVPAPFLGDAMKGASGVAGQGGAGHLRMADEDMPANAPNIPLVQPGLYHVEITHPSVDIPARYNTQTTLGIEITSGNPGQSGVTWSLTR